MGIGISAVVLTKNEAENIVDCLAMLAWADERVVLDAFSADETLALAEAAGARVRQRAFQDYADQRMAALKLITHDWVFFVDADARCTPGLSEEIRHVTAEREEVGWWVSRHNYIFGHRMRGAGWYPDYQLRLFRRDRGHYDPQRRVHELVILDGPAGHLRNPLVHYNYATLKEFITRQEGYAVYEAGILFASGQRARHRNFVLQPLREFRRRFFTWHGYRDGRYGLLLSALMAYYEFVKYWKLWQLQREHNHPPT